MKKINLKTTLLSLSFTILAISFTAAQSNDGREHKRPTFTELLKKMDSNKDGMLSKEEVKGPLKDNFATIDLDKNGFISEEEFKKAPKSNDRKGREK